MKRKGATKKFNKILLIHLLFLFVNFTVWNASQCENNMSPIPDFDHNHVLPPHLGNPAQPSDLSPFQCTILEFCHRFATSPARIDILKKFVAFRLRMGNTGIVNGFQWLNGSFAENIEVSEGREPRDLDVVTFYRGQNLDQSTINVTFPEFFDPTLAKKNYLLDHYTADYSFMPEATVELTRYWIQLFTHKRNNVWKGILRISLNTAIDDQASLDYLNSM